MAGGGGLSGRKDSPAWAFWGDLSKEQASLGTVEARPKEAAALPRPGSTLLHAGGPALLSRCGPCGQLELLFSVGPSFGGYQPERDLCDTKWDGAGE